MKNYKHIAIIKHNVVKTNDKRTSGIKTMINKPKLTKMCEVNHTFGYLLISFTKKNSIHIDIKSTINTVVTKAIGLIWARDSKIPFENILIFRILLC